MSPLKVAALGLGAMGSAAAATLARRGCKVIGFEQLWRAHNQGSSHGDTSAIRKAYVREEQYASLVLETYDLWQKLERGTGAELLREIGGLVVVPAGGRTLARSIATETNYGIPHEVLEPAEVTRRWPRMHPPAGTATFYERSLSIIPPEKTVATHIELAIRHGAELHFNTPVNWWKQTENGVEIVAGDRVFTADKLIIAGGAWSEDVLAEFFPVKAERLFQVWVKPNIDTAAFSVAHHPRWVLENEDGRAAYAFPILEGQDAIKLAFTAGTPADRSDLQRQAFAGEVEALVEFMSQLVPSIRGQGAARAAACFSAKAQDDKFVIGPHPHANSVIVAAGFGSHGFKFVPVIGEILADLAVDGATKRDISLFDPQRFVR
ncbi:N-methyl-L-tryptophan oxidase [Mesorhizobium sp. VK23B]|uniref:N-methyl-L-tryptophan oxidase n=1 Tax=Mesorhizobium dulcispinae TaxID=3072316 RepID=A0ABU4XRT5_9HYPH|nr:MULTISPECIES: N-methyl-L-tryptophan oxidase [unclassified Mesorhizobium]MDX8470169.1 N-methyl-L-tryptophan oxidase [Mesorhizobium sp. VK23B]MDX8476555.1 N-methyl-L-tryptophan oxidase [Mesorhizobium sp. VK23A]